MTAIDAEHWFCELSKYARVAHPDANNGGRSKIKQVYYPEPADKPIELMFPPKWKLGEIA